MLTLIAMTLFVLSSTALAVYGIHLYFLIWLAHRRRARLKVLQSTIIGEYQARTRDDDWPVVTTQLPLYNEKDVARRVIESVAALDYPKDRHEIQVLDDSNDETRGLVDSVAARLRSQGIDIKVVRRDNRAGYKAGALAHGLQCCRGEFVAIFDADFLPKADFLRRTVSLMTSDGRICCVQGRWDHLNAEENWLTRAQALGIDGHFAVEQAARGWNGFFLNFNGTAGIWRKTAIEDPAVGGWEGDTLTEDLDLSYRAQLAGWRIEYCSDILCPAEIPADMPAFKNQQRRWATGSIQCARKLLPRVWASSFPLTRKLEATLHLTYYSVSLWMLLMLLAALPMMVGFWLQNPVMTGWIWLAWAVVLTSTFAPPLLYIYSRRTLRGDWRAVIRIPLLMALGMGACLEITLAVLRGLVVRGGEFVRTPKSGSTVGRRNRSSYRPLKNSLWLAELGLGGYALVSATCYAAAEQWPSMGFLAIYAAGLLVVGWATRPSSHSHPFTAASAPNPLSSVSAA